MLLNHVRKLIFVSIAVAFCLLITEDFPANAGAGKDQEMTGRVVFRPLVVAEATPRIIESKAQTVEAPVPVAEAPSRDPEATTLRLAESDRSGGVRRRPR